MTQEEKNLLLKDLCARLPYGVMVFVKDYNEPCVVEAIYDNLDVKIKGCLCYNLAFECKPYLRPMSSMTEEERQELKDLCSRYDNDGDASTYEYWSISVFNESRYGIYYDNNFDAIDWLNAHHFDYRGLIPMGLALEATEGMYNLN